MKFLQIDYADGAFSLGEEVPADHPEAVPMSDDLYRFWLLHCEQARAWQKLLRTLDNARHEDNERLEALGRASWLNQLPETQP